MTKELQEEAYRAKVRSLVMRDYMERLYEDNFPDGGASSVFEKAVELVRLEDISVAKEALILYGNYAGYEIILNATC